MPRMYCGHIGSLNYPLSFQISPLVSFYEVLAARSADVYEPSYFSNVPTFATSRLQEILAAKGGTAWARNGRWILPENARLPLSIQGSFTCRKSTTWDRRLYFHSEGRKAEHFFRPEKSNGFGRVWIRELGVPKASRLPIDHRSITFIYFVWISEQTVTFAYTSLKVL